MTLVLEVAAGYLLGRFVAYHAGLLARVAMRRLVLGSSWWQARIREDDRLDADLKRAVGREPQAASALDVPPLKGQTMEKGWRFR